MSNVFLKKLLSKTKKLKRECEHKEGCSEIPQGKLPPGKFPLIKLPSPLENPHRRILTQKIPTWNIPTHFINCLSSLFT